MYSSDAKGLLYSLEYGINMDDTAFYSSKREDNGNQKLHSKKTQNSLLKANSVYNLPSTEQGIKWMHAVCGHPVKSMWLKAIAAGNFIWCPLLNVRNVKKHYPETTETPKGHMNQTRKNVRSAKVMETCNATTLKGKKVGDIGIHVYNVRETIFSNQTGEFPKQSQRGYKYIMVMVK